MDDSFKTLLLHIIVDKERKYYHLFHSQFLLSKLFSMRTWQSTFVAFFNVFFPHFNKFEGGVIWCALRLLVDENRSIIDLNYGRHFGDSWTVSDVLNRNSLQKMNGCDSKTITFYSN